MSARKSKKPLPPLTREEKQCERDKEIAVEREHYGAADKFGRLTQPALYELGRKVPVRYD